MFEEGNGLLEVLIFYLMVWKMGDEPILSIDYKD
jgi:hypothetical protein